MNDVSAPPKQAAAATEPAPLQLFEAACYRRDHATAVKLLKALLTKPVDILRSDKSDIGNERQRTTRFAAAFLALILNPKFKLGKELLIELTPLLGELQRVLLVSGFGGSEHALTQLRPVLSSELSGAQLDAAVRQRFHLLFSTDTQVKFDILKVFEEDPLVAMLLILHYLSTKPVATLLGQERREQLLDAADRMAEVTLPDHPHFLVLLSQAWINCSYAGRRRKHEIKRPLNRIVRNMMLARGLKDEPMPAQRRLADRPRMVVASERIHSNHVQYRYFGQWFRQLRQRFELVLVGETHEIDDNVSALFDSTFGFKRDNSGRYLNEVRDFIVSQKPDLLFYPSVGMRHWGVALANLRLAPIQFTALGHSASTFCPTVDYFVIERGYVGDETLLTEKLILLEDTDLFFERSPYYRKTEPELREKPGVLRVVLASNALKLNPAFIKVVAAIAERSPRPIEFHIFPGVDGLEYEAAKQVYRERLRNAVVHAGIPYADYLRRLNACDLSLSPWPFGGLHSVVDALRQGIPVVAMDGLEPHARTDGVVLRRAGMPDWLLCRDAETYIKTALRVIGDDALRMQLSRHALACDIDNKMFGDATTPLDHGIIDSVWAMYRHHERIKASPRQGWGREELAALDREPAARLVAAG